jgi:hypothetical protein
MDKDYEIELDMMEATRQLLHEDEDTITKEQFVEIGRRFSKMYVKLAEEVKRDLHVDIIQRLVDYTGTYTVVDVLADQFNLNPEDDDDLTEDDMDKIVEPFEKIGF